MDWGRDSQYQSTVRENGEEGTIRELWKKWTGRKLVTHWAVSESRRYKDHSEDLRTRSQQVQS